MRKIPVSRPYSFRRLQRFLGNRVMLLFFVGCVTGVALFVVELGFAYSIQAFLVAIGVANAQTVELPGPLSALNTTNILELLVTIALVRAILQWTNAYLQGATPAYFTYIQRERLLNWCFSSHSASTDEVTRYFNERTSLASNAILYIQSAIVQISTAVFLGISLMLISWPITLASGVLLVVLWMPIRFLSLKVKDSGLGVSHEGAQVNSRLIMNLRNLILLRIYGMQEKELAHSKKGITNYLRHYITYSKATGVLSVAPQFVGIILVCAIASIGKTKTGIASGLLLSYFYLFIRFLQNVSNTANSVSSASFYRPQLEELREWWENESKILAPPVTDTPKESRKVNTPIGWEILNLSFAYAGTSRSILKDFQLTVSPGTTTVITGSSGSGKSTLLNLLLGMEKPTSGEVFIQIDGQSYLLPKEQSALLTHVGYVGPESFLVEGTLLENLTYGLTTRPEPNKIREALALAECGFVDTLTNGLQHRLTEQGQGLSAGQKQRLSLARALLRDPKALILDEATSNLDAETEQKLVTTFEKLKGRLTLVAVTHRHELLRIADQKIQLETMP